MCAGILYCCKFNAGSFTFIYCGDRFVLDADVNAENVSVLSIVGGKCIWQTAEIRYGPWQVFLLYVPEGKLVTCQGQNDFRLVR